MFRFKKDWLYDYKILITLSFSSIMMFLIMYGLTINISNKVYWEVSKGIVETVTNLLTAWIMMLPIISVASVCPLNPDKFGSKVKTCFLPISKKQIVWKGIKMWLVVLPLIIIASTFVNILFENRISSYALSDMILGSISESIALIIFFSIYDMQIMGTMIIMFAKNIRWYSIVPIQVLINIVVILGSLFLISLTMDTGKDITWLVVLFIIILATSLIYFIVAFRDIEKVYR